MGVCHPGYHCTKFIMFLPQKNKIWSIIFVLLKVRLKKNKIPAKSEKCHSSHLTPIFPRGERLTAVVDNYAQKP